MKINRINKIQEMLERENSISINRLCEVFAVSKNTIRRDINDLEERGLIKKVYGGIMLKKQKPASPEPFNLRETKNARQKQKVARLAATFVEDEDVIFIDSGTTTMHMLPYLLDKQNLTIVTASVNVINAAAAYAPDKKFNVIATGGSLYYPSMAFVGPSVMRCLDNYNISKIFLASTGISLENGATNASTLENEIKRCLINKTGQKFLLVDSSKLDVASLMTYCELKDFDYVIMDKLPPAKYLTYFKEKQVRVLAEERQEIKD